MPESSTEKSDCVNTISFSLKLTCGKEQLVNYNDGGLEAEGERGWDRARQPVVQALHIQGRTVWAVWLLSWLCQANSGTQTEEIRFLIGAFVSSNWTQMWVALKDREDVSHTRLKVPKLNSLKIVSCPQLGWGKGRRQERRKHVHLRPYQRDVPG